MYKDVKLDPYLPTHKWVTSLSGLWKFLTHQYYGSTVDMPIIVGYINKVAEATKVPVWEIYGNVYRRGGFNFRDKPAELSKIAYLKQTGQLRAVAKIIIEDYDYDEVKKMRSEVRKQAKQLRLFGD